MVPGPPGLATLYLLDAAPRRDRDLLLDPVAPNADPAVVEVRHDAGMVGEDADPLADPKGSPRLDLEDAVLLGEPDDESAGPAPDHEAVAAGAGAERVARERLRPRVDDGAVGGRNADDGRQDGQGAVLEAAAPERDLGEVVVDVGPRPALGHAPLRHGRGDGGRRPERALPDGQPRRAKRLGRLGDDAALIPPDPCDLLGRRAAVSLPAVGEEPFEQDSGESRDAPRGLERPLGRHADAVVPAVDLEADGQAPPRGVEDLAQGPRPLLAVRADGNVDSLREREETPGLVGA